MIYRRRTYVVHPERVEAFTAFFHAYLLPNQWKHGARLVGRYVNEAQDEVTALWEYESLAEYERIQALVAADERAAVAKAKKAELEAVDGPLFVSMREEFLTATGAYHTPRHIVAAAGYITNAVGEVLLVKTFWRSDTYELPGGQVELGEPLAEACRREIEEESGLTVELTGVVGVYQNTSTDVVLVLFRGHVTGGELITHVPGEIQDARFVALTEENAAEYLTRPNMRTRALDAMRGLSAPLETVRVRPYELLSRFEPV